MYCRSVSVIWQLGEAAEPRAIMGKFMQARRRPKKYKKRKQCTIKKATTSTSNTVEVVEEMEKTTPWYLNLSPPVWFRFPVVRNTANTILNAFLALYLWSYYSVKKPFILIKNILSPSLICRRELCTLRKRLHKLEIEFLKLQLTVQTKETSLTSGNQCCCSCRQATTVSVIKEPNGQVLAEHNLPSLPPPPPPPPPPPLPPVPPPTFPLQKSLLALKKVETTRPQKVAPAKQEGPITITLKDLLNVKLRKARDNIERQKVRSDRSECFPLITASELKLKLASKMPPKRLANIFKDTLNKSPLNLRRHLRKVNMMRSPGGTPLYDRDNKENGTGLTPLMTKALRQKFQLAHPKSPSPLRLSPIN